LAVANYHDANGRYPPPYVTGPDGRPWHSWRVLILPYIEQMALYKEYSFAEPWDGPNNRKLAGRMPRLYAFHGWERPGNTMTNYLAVVGDETVWPGSKAVTSADVTDGPNTTIMLVENSGANVHWMEPRDLSLTDMDLRLNSPGGVSSLYEDPAVVMLDGSVQRLRPTLKPAVLRALLTIRGGEPLGTDDSGGWELLPDGRLRVPREP
jgi:hypothetical protein